MRWACRLCVVTICLGLAVNASPNLARAQDGADALAPPPPPPGARATPQPLIDRDDDIPREPIPPAPPEATAPYRDGGTSLRPSDQAEIDIPARIATRLRVLDADLRTLSTRRSNLIIDGILSILSGALSITLGILVPDDQQSLSNYMYVWGSANIARGVVDLALSPRSEEASIAFSHMPTTTIEEVRTRLRFGENALESIARRARLSRIIQASLNIGAGLAVIPVYLGPSDFEVSNPYDYFVIIGSGISVIAGIVNLVNRSEAEQRYEAYQDLRNRLERERRRSARVGVSPIAGGGLATFQLEL